MSGASLNVASAIMGVRFISKSSNRLLMVRLIKIYSLIIDILNGETETESAHARTKFLSSSSELYINAQHFIDYFEGSKNHLYKGERL